MASSPLSKNCKSRIRNWALIIPQLIEQGTNIAKDHFRGQGDIFLAEIIGRLEKNWQTLMQTRNLLMYFVFYRSWGWGKHLIFVSGPLPKTQDMSNNSFYLIWFFFFFEGRWFQRLSRKTHIMCDIWVVLVWLKWIPDHISSIPVDLHRTGNLPKCIFHKHLVVYLWSRNLTLLVSQREAELFVELWYFPIEADS